jgi:hypothetical protein
VKCPCVGVGMCNVVLLVEKVTRLLLGRSLRHRGGLGGGHWGFDLSVYHVGGV